jgi:hypothetical protein
MQKTKQWLVLNAVYAWLHHYGDQVDSVVMKHQYEELKKELENEQSKNTTSKKRGRPAKRQRTQKTASTAVSKTTSKDA